MLRSGWIGSLLVLSSAAASASLSPLSSPISEARLAAVSQLFIPPDLFLEGPPALAMDYQGRIAAVWPCVGRFAPNSDLCSSFYTRRGFYKGGFLFVDEGTASPSIAFGRGSLLAAWVGFGGGRPRSRPGSTPSSARTSSEDYCLVRGTRLLCRHGADPAAPLTAIPVSRIAAGDVPMIGDIDGL